jgi:hypothetical protein
MMMILQSLLEPGMNTIGLMVCLVNDLPRHLSNWAGAALQRAATASSRHSLPSQIRPGSSWIQRNSCLELHSPIFRVRARHSFHRSVQGVYSTLRATSTCSRAAEMVAADGPTASAPSSQSLSTDLAVVFFLSHCCELRPAMISSFLGTTAWAGGEGEGAQYRHQASRV